MAHILISMLGKVKNPKFPNYLEANYVFPDGSEQKSRFFGLTLCNHIQPDKLVILGTSGSMWDNLLLETSLGKREDLDDEILKLAEAAQDDRVQQATLDQLAVHLSEDLGIPCELRLIPYGRTEAEQTETLNIMVERFAEHDQASLDVTHGLRHLPMLMQQSALLLQTLKQVNISGIYYGALDLTQNAATPVMSLDGLLRIHQWTEALTHYDKSGNYDVFADLLVHSGLPDELVDHLQDASFYEQTNNISLARGKLKKFVKGLKEHRRACNPQAQLFFPALEARFSWINGDKLYQRQTQVAWTALNNNNYIRASIYGFEAFITRHVQERGGNPDRYESRHHAKSDFEKLKEKSNKTSAEKQLWDDYRLLREIRNQFAHSTTADASKETLNAISNRAELKQTLTKLFEALIPNG